MVLCSWVFFLLPATKEVKVVIVVPAFNESPVIYKVLKSIPKKIKGTSLVAVVVVNDGSGDNTQSEAQRAGFPVINHVINRGLGAAIKTGMEYAREKKADIMVTFDGDGQHEPSDIQKIIVPIIHKKADLVIGSRFKKLKNIPPDRYFLNWIANLITFLFYGALTTDSQSGLRAFSQKALNLIDFKGERMDFSSEILLEAKRNNLKKAEVPIKAIYTEYSRKKGQKNSNAIPTFARFLVRLLR